MKILVIGSGGREHTLTWKIKQSPKVSKLYCAPGNAGTSQDAENVKIKAEDVKRLLDYAKKNNIDLTVVGPEVPLALGIVDEFEKEELNVFGPRKDAARLEASKIFAKEKIKKYKIPTAEWRAFYEGQTEDAVKYLKSIGKPMVVKADGLAAGKGVTVAGSIEETEKAIISAMKDGQFKEAGKKVVLEERLIGEEASLLAFVDGKSVKTMVAAQDHKAIFDQDKGPNTGGMGAYSPTPIVDEGMVKKVEEEILIPMVKGLSQEGIVYKGVLYAGLMITEEGPKVIEFNVRFGDPETQVILPRLKNDLVEVMEAVVEERLDEIELEWDERNCVCVVLASGGYPGSYEKELPIEGLNALKDTNDVIVFHAGTKQKEDMVVTNGGRVLGVTAFGNNIESAIDNVYKAIPKISFKDMYYRKDIGHKALTRFQCKK